MNKALSLSMMCCDFLDLKEQLKIFEEKNIEYLHLDIMDGTFVPNYTLGVDFMRQLHDATDIPLDVHLMVENPEKCIEWFPVKDGDLVSIHYESSRHIQRTLQKIKDKGGSPLLALNPATPVCMAEDVLDDITGVLLMTVNPGYAGQKLIPHGLEKIAAMRRFLDERGYAGTRIEVDGNVSFENAALMSKAGADIFVAGSSSVFGGDLRVNIDSLRNAVK